MSKTEANVNAIVSVTLIFLVSATETIGDTSALAVSGLGRDATTKETSGSAGIISEKRAEILPLRKSR